MIYPFFGYSNTDLVDYSAKEKKHLAHDHFFLWRFGNSKETPSEKSLDLWLMACLSFTVP